MLKDLKFALQIAMHAPFLISLQLTNIFNKDQQKVNITTLAVLQGIIERP